ncbi:hypothetical protein SISNIDRAFT_547077 [Sistotremastrum niveocremeum HHB9708]|uniref:Uncharacterized protein n=1 Tax=Sistotremastrum niveocremeum HHB9708 TaxID=1314777 RepID=A0A164ZU29_9AGAM|nr:hypothetical protein SISNIDRAFT_547077 [Sistotremastrum niveocremeum HHB9708]
MATAALRRSIYREFIRSANSRRAAKDGAPLRFLLHPSKKDLLEKYDDRGLENIRTFLRANRLHKGLLERYNPLHDLTTEERIKATARRVGLDMPEDVDPNPKDGS